MKFQPKIGDRVTLTSKPGAKVFTVQSVNGYDIGISYRAADTGEWVKPIVMQAYQLKPQYKQVLNEDNSMTERHGDIL